MERKVAWLDYGEQEKAALTELNERYKEYISAAKTERECVAEAISLAEKQGYRNIAQVKSLKAGDKVYACCMKKTLALFQIGEEPLEMGMNILGAHIDSPRLDLKPNPLYEDSTAHEAFLDTHYYGGIKKYQWVTLPLAIHGAVVKKDGTVINVVVGEAPEDPVFCITDLLPHLGADQMGKKASEVIEGENLDILIGSEPLQLPEDAKDKKDAIKQNILKILQESYGIEEEDFYSAEIEIVPAGKARDLGFDRSMVLGYGQDDRICAFTSLEAQLTAGPLKKTGVCLLVDKEEIGSVGATGMQSRFFENAVAEVMNLLGDYSELKVRRAMQNSRMLSSDVSAIYDSAFAGAYEAKNSAFLGHGLSFNKYTGARGKSGSNDASAEYLSVIRRIMDEAGVKWQIAELGKVDQGGGGTIAYIMGNYGMEVIDSGIGVLSMHAPWEAASKADIYEAVKGYKAFLKNA